MKHPQLFKFWCFWMKLWKKQGKSTIQKMGQSEPPLKIFLFLKMKFCYFFLISMDQKYQNESAPIFYYAKSKKYCLKLLKIAVLQPPDWIQRKKTPCILSLSLSFYNYRASNKIRTSLVKIHPLNQLQSTIHSLLILLQYRFTNNIIYLMHSLQIVKCTVSVLEDIEMCKIHTITMK